jgi:hypothetical protein
MQHRCVYFVLLPLPGVRKFVTIDPRVGLDPVRDVARVEGGGVPWGVNAGGGSRSETFYEE